MHRIVDKLYLHKLKLSIEQAKHVLPDVEEQKKLDVEKQYTLFTREAEELHKQMEERLYRKR